MTNYFVHGRLLKSKRLVISGKKKILHPRKLDYEKFSVMESESNTVSQL